ncbi:hypothetical protein HMPREF0620_1421 [Parascardovia denticolens DSM 10105 = JCM 12538]|uniref:Uncharacterized protein n=1 Tax=Parascardovia denticolens DSM 10105 = JCM 12538 TaxID=864564 RepID=E6K1U8_PARDN|nr:hypothetical protein HMPREF0620_1421 [Parascardovia denticolens DSM 10105 = JCM 12538]
MIVLFAWLFQIDILPAWSCPRLAGDQRRDLLRKVVSLWRRLYKNR